VGNLREMEGDGHQERSQGSRTLFLYAATATSVWAGLAGCSVHAPEGTVGTYLAPTNIGDGSSAADSGDAGFGSFTLRMLIRDFKKYDKIDPSTNPDFHNGAVVSELNVVSNVLGSDGKPTYQTPTNTIKTFGKTYFDQWYNDVPGTNLRVEVPLTLTMTAEGLYEYDSQKTGTFDTSAGTPRLDFFPIDDGSPYATTFGNQGDPHNLGFTGELHAIFTYEGQGILKCRSDDDLYAFVRGNLVINLGGQHIAEEATFDVTALGLTVGVDYPLDVFYAERAGRTGDLLVATSINLRDVGGK
jgi:fibro-slime domain-containing protein